MRARGVAAAGTFTTTDAPDANGFYEITAITGQANRVAITGLQPAGTAIPGNDGYPVDNLVRTAAPQLLKRGFGYARHWSAALFRAPSRCNGLMAEQVLGFDRSGPGSRMEGAARKPDQVIRVPVHGYEVVTYSFGRGEEVLLCLNGGPGLPCDYVRDSHSRIAGDQYRVVAFDQLGCGASDRPSDDALWTLHRYVEEVEIVRSTLGLGKVHLLGQSWGAWLGIEYALTYPEALKTLILANGAANIPHAVGEIMRLREALGSETVAMMLRHEAEGAFEHPEYKAAIGILTHRHICRMQEWPAALQRSVRGANPRPFVVIQGPNDFSAFTGNIKDWNRVDQLHRIKQPALVMCGMHDVLTPACSRLMHEALPDSRITIFPNSGHLPFWEEPEAYFAALLSFLDAHAGQALT